MRRRLAARVALPVVTLFLLALASGLFGIGFVARQMDEVRRHAEQETARNALVSLSDSLQRTVGDYALWDVAFDTMRRAPVDPLIADTIFGPYLFETFGWTGVVVVAPDGDLLYAHDAERRLEPAEINAELGPAVRLMASRAKAVPRQATQRSVSGFVTIEGRLHFTAAAVIQPSSANRRAAEPGPFPVLVAILDVTAAEFVTTLSRFGLTDVVVAPEAPAALPARVGLRVENASQPWVLAWQPQTPGGALWLNVAPYLGGGLVLLGFAMLVMLRQATRVTQRMQASILRSVEAEAAAREKEKFITTMSHELRTPLNAVIGFSDIMADELFGPHAVPAYKDYAASIRDSGRHLLAIVDDVLLMGKLVNGQYSADLDAVLLDDAVAAAVAASRPFAESRAVRLSVQMPPRLPPAMAEARALDRVLRHLIGNAIKFSPGGAEVVVSVARATGSRPLGITIADQGVGIAPEKLAVLGRPFAQVEDALAREYGGAGLGLAIARALVEVMGGTLTLVSEPGAGTRAVVALPAARTAARGAAA